MKKIMLMARDPGGANTIIPLIPALQTGGYEVVLYGKDAALSRYRQFGLEGVDIVGLMPSIDIAGWTDFLSREKPDFIITGTSGDDFSERYLWTAAGLAGIKSFAILDQWMNYGIRFSGYRPGEANQYKQDRQHPYLPDKILVMDDEARSRMIMDGIPADRVLISGQPYFDLVLQQKQQSGKKDRQKIRQAMGITEQELLISYISEPISQDYGQKEEDERYLGYDEKSIFLHMMEALNEITGNIEQPIHFVIKQHPREPEQNYQAIIKDFGDGPIIISVAQEIDSWSLLLASDLVCGMSSMLLLESVLLDRPTISVQIGLKHENPLILDKLGILKSILQADELKQLFKEILLKQQIPATYWSMHTGAVDKVIFYMEESLCQN